MKQLEIKQKVLDIHYVFLDNVTKMKDYMVINHSQQLVDRSRPFFFFFSYSVICITSRNLENMQEKYTIK